MTKYSLPDWVSKYKEPGKSIKIKNGSFFLYESKCVYDKSKKHKNKTENVYLGRITQIDGFIPVNKKSNMFIPSNITSRVYGPYKIIEEVTSTIRERLKRFFGDDADRIFTIAALRAIENTPYYQLEDGYNESYYSVAYKNLSMSKSSLSDLLHELSKSKSIFQKYMREDIDKKDVLIFDGTNIYCGSHNISYVSSGYKHGHNYKTQANIMYAYSSKKHQPIYYKLFEGSITDKCTIKDFISEAQIKGNTILIDAGFISDLNITELVSTKNKYILALPRSSSLVTNTILNDLTRELSKEKFINNKEAVYAYEILEEDYRICIYFNEAISARESAEYISKINNKWKGYTEENRKEDMKRFGIYIIKTNIKHYTLKTIYEYYKSRFEIEYMFDTLKNTLDLDLSYMHSDASFESWTFINHITMSIMYQLYECLREADLLTNNPPRKLLKQLRQVVMCRNTLDKKETYSLQVIPKKSRVLFETLKIIL